MNSEIELRDHVLVGPLRRSVNNARHIPGSIHDDATATKLGFRGGTVAGSIHLELFPPLLLKAFGQRWFERGTISMYFLNATTDREAVRAFVKEPPLDPTDAQVDVWVERDDGMRVAKGSASVGSPQEATALLRRPLDRFDAGQLRILGGLKPGDRLCNKRLRHKRSNSPRRRARSAADCKSRRAARDRATDPGGSRTLIPR